MGYRGRFFLVILSALILSFTHTTIQASVPGIVGQDEGGTGASPVSFNTGEGSEMSGGHRVNVNVTTGNLTVKHTDLVIPTKGKDIVIERTYNSIRSLHGIESGVVFSSGMNPDYLTVTDGVAWINGERLEVTGISLSGWPNFAHADHFLRKIFVVNDNGVARIEYNIGTSFATNKL